MRIRPNSGGSTTLALILLAGLALSACEGDDDEPHAAGGTAGKGGKAGAAGSAGASGSGQGGSTGGQSGEAGAPLGGEGGEANGSSTGGTGGRGGGNGGSGAQAGCGGNGATGAGEGGRSGADATGGTGPAGGGPTGGVAGGQPQAGEGGVTSQGGEGGEGVGGGASGFGGAGGSSGGTAGGGAGVGIGGANAGTGGDDTGGTSGSAGNAGVGGGGSACPGGAACFCVKVTPSGDDVTAVASNGASAFRTVQAAIDFAAANPGVAPDVCVAAGASCGDSAAYPGPSAEDLRMRDGVDVFGAYESTTWGRCSTSSTVLVPATATGVLFGADVLGATELDGFTIRIFNAPTTVGVTIDGASGARLDDVLVTDAYAYDAGNTYGVDVKNGGGVTIHATEIRIMRSRAAWDAESIGVRVVGGRVDIEDSNLFGYVEAGRAIGVRLEASPASSIVESSVTITGRWGGDGEFPAWGVHTSGDSNGLLLSGLVVDMAAGDVVAGIELAGTGDGVIRGTEIEVVGGGSTVDGIRIGAGADVLVQDNQVTADFSNWRTAARGDITGIHCDGTCTVLDNQIEVDHSDTTIGDAGGSFGIACTGCDEVSGNEVSLLGGNLGGYRIAYYEAVGIDVGAGGAFLNGNDVDVGCADVATGVIATNSRIQNNFITGRVCSFRDDLPSYTRGLVAGSGSDIHSNSISSGSCVGENDAAVLLTGTGAKLRNNILGGCGLNVRESGAGRDPAVIENNDFLGPSYADGPTLLTTLAQINALSGATANFSAPCTTASPWPCIDTGTATEAPVYDAAGTPRDSIPDVGPIEWADPCIGQSCDGQGTCLPGGCACNPGYVQDPSDRLSCIVDACSVDNGGCDPLVNCTNSAGGPSCGACPAGYLGTGDSGCYVDVCATDNGGCDELTTCTSTPDGADCGACPPGYQGTGETGCEPDTTPFVQVSAGGSHTCGIRESGALECWGFQPFFYSVRPIGEVFTAVSAGAEHTIAIREDGTLVFWGNDQNGLGTVPSGTFDSVVAGYGHDCAMREDGTLACWGWNGSGQTDVPTGVVAAYDVGTTNTCVLHTNGTIQCVGSNDNGESVPPAGTFEALTVHGIFGCGLRADGSVECWGYADLAGWQPTHPGPFEEIQGTGNGFTVCGRQPDDTLLCYGNSSGGLASPPPDAIASYSMGVFHGCAILEDETVSCWGSNQYGQSDPP
jgi:hypothetical protein